MTVWPERKQEGGDQKIIKQERKEDGLMALFWRTSRWLPLTGHHGHRRVTARQRLPKLSYLLVSPRPSGRVVESLSSGSSPWFSMVGRKGSKPFLHFMMIYGSIWIYMVLNDKWVYVVQEVKMLDLLVLATARSPSRNSAVAWLMRFSLSCRPHRCHSPIASSGWGLSIQRWWLFAPRTRRQSCAHHMDVSSWGKNKQNHDKTMDHDDMGSFVSFGHLLILALNLSQLKQSKMHPPLIGRLK